MNFNFEGNYKQRRAISLGGVKSQEDKRALLLKNQEQRRAREAERLRLKCATKIQSFYRGRHATSLARRAERTQFSSRLSSLRSLLASSNASTDENARLLVELVQSFLFFNRVQEDGTRAMQLCNLLGTRVVDGWEVVWVPAVAGGMEEVRKRWRWQVRKVLEMAVVMVEECSGRQSTLEATSFLHLIQIATDPTNADRLQPYDPTLYSLLLSHLIYHTHLYHNIYQYLNSLDDKSLPTVATAISIVFNPLRYAQSSVDMTLQSFVVQSLIRYVLAIPALPNRISIDSLTQVSVKLPFDEVVAKIVEMEERQDGGLVVEGGWVGTAGLLGNVLAFGHKRVNKMSQEGLIYYLRVLQLLLLRLPPTLLNHQDSAATNNVGTFDDDDASDDDDIRMTDALPDSYAVQSQLKLDPRLLKWLSQLYDPTHLSSLIGFHLNRAGSLPTIAKLANYLVTLMIQWPYTKDNLLTHLMYTLPVPPGRGGREGGSGSMLRVLWEAWKAAPIGKKVVGMRGKKMSVGYVTDPANAEDWAILVLLCEVFSLLLMMMGDAEFFDQAKNPLKLKEVVEMSGVLRDIAFTLFWNDVDLKRVLQGTSIQILYLRNIVTKLTQQIHGRDSRRPFCPATHWLAPDLDVESFARSVIAEEQAIEADQPFTRHHLATVSPRLGVLNNIPFVLPFEDRVEIFRQFVATDRQRSRIDDYFHQPVERAKVHRDSVFQDGFEQLNKLGSKLKVKIAISFIDQFGLAEAGIDGGGVFKEFLTALAQQAFDTNYGLFLSTPENLLYPNPHAFAIESQQLAYFEFLGRIIGKALYEGILVDVAFAGFFLSKWLRKQNYLDDLPSLDPELYQGLISLRNYDGNVEDLALDFTVTSSEFGKSDIIDLIPNGRNIPVTNANRIRYIHLMADYRLNTQIDRQCRAFLRGLTDLVEPKWLRMFNQQELQILLGGASTPIDIEDLRLNTQLSGYTETDPTIQNLWQIVAAMNNDQRKRFLKFVTSCSRPPLLGFKELNPHFCIRNAGEDDERLPTSSTCVNLLKLPNYSKFETLRKKLLYAINAEAGFDLS